jgi:hypothetical protein
MDAGKAPARLVREAFWSAERQFRFRTTLRENGAAARALQNLSAFRVPIKINQSQSKRIKATSNTPERCGGGRLPAAILLSSTRTAGSVSCPAVPKRLLPRHRPAMFLALNMTKSHQIAPK